MAEALTADLCVIGGGPGGIAAARAAAAAGLAVVLIEKQTLGGANLAAGAVPLAALMAAASVSDALRRGPSIGVSGAPLQVNLAKVRDHVAQSSAALRTGMSAAHLAAEGIKVVAARARFLNAQTVSAGEAVIRPRRVILAVGGHAAAPELPGLGNIEQLSAEDAFNFVRKPSHLVVLGASAWGLALAQAHARLGIDATVIDEGPLLPAEDAELSNALAARLIRDGVRLRTGAKVERITRRRGGLRVVLREGEAGETVVDGSHILLAGGRRRPAVEGLGLDAAGIAHDDAGIAVDRFRTANRCVYAIGDAVAGEASVLRAEHEARAVVRAILFRRRASLVGAPPPRATLTDPALATVGLTEAEARPLHRSLRIRRYPFVENERAVVERLPDGFLKVVTTAGGRVLGASALGRDAAEHIALWSLVMEHGLPLQGMATLSAAYPSRSDLARALAESAYPSGLTGGLRRRIIRLLGKFG